MTENGSSPKQVYGQSESFAPLSAIELSVLNQLLEGYSIAEISANAGFSDILVASTLRCIQTKTQSNNMVQATIRLVQSGTLKI